MDYEGSLEHSGLLERPNVNWLGWKPYHELFKYVWNFSIAIIPFIDNDITRATSPVKLLEFFACQKPVVSTPLPECVRYPEVLTASDARSFADCIQQALDRKDDPQFCRRLDGMPRLNPWSSCVQQIEVALAGRKT